MGRIRRLALWGSAVLMGVTAVAAGELDPAWATSPMDAARAADVSGSDGPSGPAAGSPAKAGPRPYGLSMLVLTSNHCQYGQWSSGRCRACPVGQVWITGTGCVTATSTRRCSSGNTYFSSYRGCWPTTCTNGRTSTGTCRPACPSGQTYLNTYGGCRPTTCTNGRTSTGTCRACPAGQSYFNAYNGCRPTSCTNGRTSTGTCRTCPAGQTYISAYSGCRPTTCANGRRSDGTCRACADPTHMRINGACRPKTAPASGDPACPAGQLYYSSYRGCRPTSCTFGRTSTGTCQPCPAGQTLLVAYGTACVPAACLYGRTNTWTCELPSPSHRYTNLNCTTYSANASAREYLNVDTNKHDRATCPPEGLFLASPEIRDWPKWGFQQTVADDFGKIVVEESGECSGPRDSLNLDYPDTSWFHDYQVPCKAHDYCFDLRRAGLNATVTDNDCDILLQDLMYADCNKRQSVAKGLCEGQADLIRGIQRFVDQGPQPGLVNFVNVKTGKCISVKSSSVADDTDVVQSSCINGKNQRFSLHSAAGSAGYFQIKPAHSTDQNMCVAVAVASLKQNPCNTSSQQQAFRLDSVSGDTWAIKRKNLTRSCWTVPYTDSSGRAITPADGTALVNVLCTPATRSNQVWQIQKAGSRVLSTRLRTTPTTAPPTAPPDTTAPESVPAAPSGLSATGGTRGITLSWTDPGDSSITGYQFRERPSFDSEWWCWSGIWASGASTVTHRVAGLSSGTTYRIQVRARNAVGTGLASEVTATTAAASSTGSAPAAPAGLSGAPGDQSITLSWNNPGDSSIIEYQFREMSDNEASWRCWRRISGSIATTTGHTMPSITNDVRYRVQLRAVNAAGAGAVSEISATPTATPSP